MDNAERICDSVCIIARGEKVLDGVVSEVKAASGKKVVALAVAGEARTLIAQVLADRTLVSRVDDQNRFYEIDVAPGADPQRLLHRVLETGAVVQRFELVQPSLHQIFLERVGATGVEEGMQGHG
jgi:ABC-2 type transport system ATP-binding protein